MKAPPGKKEAALRQAAPRKTYDAENVAHFASISQLWPANADAQP